MKMEFNKIEFVWYYSDVAFSFAVSLQRKYYDTDFHQWSYKHFCGGVLLQVYSKTAFILSASHCVKFM